MVDRFSILDYLFVGWLLEQDDVTIKDGKIWFEDATITAEEMNEYLY